MGILDDAIRQHLDLKRQRGATESELKELEDEAFGPPGRPGEPDFPGAEEHSGNGVGAEPAIAESEVPSEPESAPEPEEGSEDLTTVYDEASEPELDLGQPEPSEPGESASAEAPVESLDTVEHAMPEEEATPEEAAPAEEPAPARDDEQEAEQQPEPQAEPAADAQTGAQEEDVLADTPDFLRDAPEDDELWFEQGEPKDFDF
jgi:hypothetical protein